MALSSNNHPTRRRSLEAAMAVVREEGIGELTTRAIAGRSGLTQPAIYRHFSGKDELVREVLGEIRQLVYDRMERAAAIAEAGERLMATLMVFRDFAIEEPRLYDALFLQTGESAPTPAPAEGGRGANLFALLVARVGEGGRAGVVREEGPVSTALSIAAHSQGLVLLYRQGRFGSIERFADFYERSMLDMLAGLRAERAGETADGPGQSPRP